MYGAGDVRVEEVADPKLEQPTDALVRIVRACVCGCDAAWQLDVDPAVDAEYARKYQGATSAIAHITSPLARATTMRAEPR